METNLKFNSAVSTSRAQSERLLALGIKRETADMAYEYKPKHLADTDTDKDWVIVAHSPCGTDIPAWSLHRLMTLLMIGDKLGCITHNIHQNNISTYYELVIASIEHLIKIDEFNKDYLEE